MDQKSPLPSDRARHELAEYIGELVMQNVCSVSRARELEAENAQLRKLVTEAREEAQRNLAEAERHAERARKAETALTNAQDDLGRMKRRPSRAKP